MSRGVGRAKLLLSRKRRSAANSQWRLGGSLALPDKRQNERQLRRKHVKAIRIILWTIGTACVALLASAIIGDLLFLSFRR